MCSPTVTYHQRTQLAAVSGTAIRTVDRAYQGARIHDTTRERLDRAAHELGLPAPPRPVAA